MSSRFLLMVSALTFGAALLAVPSLHAQVNQAAPAATTPAPVTPASPADPNGRGWHHRDGQGDHRDGGHHRRLTQEERQARIAHFDARFFKAHGGTANGVTREDWMKHAARQFDRLDINHDGVISPYELNIAAKHWRQRHRQHHRQHHHHHGHGFHQAGGRQGPHAQPENAPAQP